MKLSSINATGLEGFANEELQISNFNKITPIIGPNGAGKSTTIEVVNLAMDFLNKNKFEAHIPEETNEWIIPNNVKIKFEKSSEELIKINHLANFIGKESSFLEIELIFLKDQKLARINSIKTQHNTLTLADVSNPWQVNPKTQQLDQKKNQLNTQLTNLNRTLAKHEQQVKANPTNAGIKTNRDNAAKAVKDMETKIQELTRSRTASVTELIKFQLSGKDQNVSKEELNNFLETVQLPPVRIIAAKEAPSDNTKNLLEFAVKKLKGPEGERDLYHEKIERLAKLLQMKVDMYEDPESGKYVLDVNGVDFYKTSAGTQTCIFYYSLVHDLPQDSIIVWDEPENGLHATRRHKLLDLMLADQRQYLLSTHATELAPPLHDKISVYKATSRTGRKPGESLDIQLEQVSDRKKAFDVLETLGIVPAATLFTANVIIWVEGPSDLFFWRHWLKKVGEPYNLIEGFDYTFMFYGGSNIGNLDIEEELEEIVNADVLSLCRFPIFIVDSDLSESPVDEDCSTFLKPNALAIKEKMNKLGENGEFICSSGREVENYLPNKAIQYAVESLSGYSEEDLNSLQLDTYELGDYEHYYESIESFVIGKGVTTTNRNGVTVAKMKSKWGSNKKAQFMKAALKCPDFVIGDLKGNAESAINTIMEFIKNKRP